MGNSRKFGRILAQASKELNKDGAPIEKLIDRPKKAANFQGNKQWIDSLRVFCKGGHGGNGIPQYGGFGGTGGKVILKTDDVDTKKNKKNTRPTNLYTIFNKTFQGDPSKQRLIAKDGHSASKSRLNGTKGDDKVLIVPKGVSVIDDNKNLLMDFNEDGQEFVVAKGGAGGNSSNNFCGLPGQKQFVRLDLKLLADIGYVGFPNAGKSTLLHAISNAKPKIANYPFTTLKPNLGHLKFNDDRIITMADLPGLIEGSHQNLGLGHNFLKHVERTKILLFVVDICGFQLGQEYNHRSAFESLVLLNRELELYNSDLLKKPCLLIVNKMDLPKAKKNLKELESCLGDDEKYEDNLLQNIDSNMIPEKRIEFREIIPISAEKDSPEFLFSVKQTLRKHLDELEDDQEEYQNKVRALSMEVNAKIYSDDKVLL